MLSYNKFLRKSILSPEWRGRHLPLIILGVLSFAIHFILIGHPNGAVFDEVHFGKFISAYFTHEYYFDIHPPLGKLILAGWGWLWGFQPGFSFANIGDTYPDNFYIALRLLPALAGALLPLVIYGIARQLGMRKATAFFAGFLVVFENALLVQSRLILLDSFLLLFGFGAMYFYLRARQTINDKRSTLWLIISGLLAGAAASIKWTGLTFLALILILEVIRFWQNRKIHPLSLTTYRAIILLVVPLLVYGSVFAIHFSLLKKSGPGDGFMSPEFRQHTLSFPEKFIELNTQMYLANQRLTATHPYSSAWYTWPFMLRPIFYWVQDASRIYLLGNPVVWWLSSVAVLVLLASLVGRTISSRLTVYRLPFTAYLLIGAWLLNLLPFIGIGRVMFLYHYFTALIWAILILAWLVGTFSNPRRIILIIAPVSLIAFLFFAPLTYGLPLSQSAYILRVWIASWR